MAEVAACNPTIPIKACNILNTEVVRLLEKEVICEVGQVQGEYVSSYFAVPKSKRSPEWRSILNFKKFNNYVRHVYFHMEMVPAGHHVCGVGPQGILPPCSYEYPGQEIPEV